MYHNRSPIIWIILAFALPILIFSTKASADYQTDLEQGVYLQDTSGDIDVDCYSVPVVYDWNNDGKKDLLVGQNNNSNGYISFFENVGIDSNPSFNAPVYVQSCNPGCAPLDVAAAG